jgi:iron complex outermembrane receptor protein
LRARQKGFAVSGPKPATNARIVRRWNHRQSKLQVALLAGGGLCLRVGVALATEPPVYETVVVGERAWSATPRQDRAASATAVVIAERTPKAVDSVTQVLSEQAGSVVTRLGGLGSTATLSLRGSTANQVSVYLDGAPLNTVTGGGVDLGAIPMGDLERVEIYRGMSPIAFGASAIGGVVSISTAVPTENKVVLDVGTGSFGAQYGGARGAWSRGRLHVYGGIHALTADGDFPYAKARLQPGDDANPRRLNNDLQQLDGTLRAVVDASEGRRISAGVLLFDRTQGLPGMVLVGNPVARLGTRRARLSLDYESPQAWGPGGRLKITVYGNYELTRFDDPDANINSIPDTHARDRTYTLGGTTTWRSVARPWLILSGILDLRDDRFSPSDSGVTGSPGNRLFGAAGVETDFWIERIHLDVIPSVRVELSREETSGRNQFYKLLPTSAPTSHVLPIARLALIEELTGSVSLRANVGRYARLPSLIELYGNTGLLLGDPTLKPERGLNADLGLVLSWSKGSSRVSWSTSTFASFIDDLIEYQYGSGHARPRNVGSARILGVETEANLQLGRHLRATLAGMLSDPRNTSPIEAENGHQLPLRPRYRFFARPEWRAIEVADRTFLGIYVECDATGRDYPVPSNIVEIPARLLFGAGAYADLPAGFSLRFTAQNLGNSNIYDLIGYPLPGREFYLTLAWSHPNGKEGENP